jgi:transcriptional regulator with XRE-family HTH domain
MSNANERNLEFLEYKRALILSGLKQYELAAYLGISPKFLSDMVHNRRSDYGIELYNQINHFINEPSVFIQEHTKQTA